MVDLKLLNQEIKASRISTFQIAEYLGMSRTALWYKLKGNRAFTIDECNDLAELLRFTNKKKLAVFFARRSSKMERKEGGTWTATHE